VSTHSAPDIEASGRARESGPTREAILAAAEQVICDRGVLSTTTRRIAETAGCSEGSIYNHFANKDTLVAHVVCERLAAFPEYARSLPELVGSGDLETNLGELVALAIDFFADMTPLTAAMMADPASMREHVHRLDEAGRGPRWTIRAIVAYLRREQELGRVTPDAHLEGAAMALVGGALHQAHLAAAWHLEVFAGDQDPPTELARAVITGLRAEPGPDAGDDAGVASNRPERTRL
jgi:AcrR family transcriptional regulator